MAHDIRVRGIMEESIVDGPGIRCVIFTQGCPHRCKGCHNPETYDLDGGFLLDAASVIAKFTENPLLTGVTFSGGEPFLQPEPLCGVAEQVKALGKTVAVYSGYTFEQLLDMAARNRHIDKLLSLSDILIDGPYVEELKDLELRFRGSVNQRLLDRPAMERLRSAYEKARRGSALRCLKSFSGTDAGGQSHVAQHDLL